MMFNSDIETCELSALQVYKYLYDITGDTIKTSITGSSDYQALYDIMEHFNGTEKHRYCEDYSYTIHVFEHEKIEKYFKLIHALKSIDTAKAQKYDELFEQIEYRYCNIDGVEWVLRGRKENREVNKETYNRIFYLVYDELVVDFVALAGFFIELMHYLTVSIKELEAMQ